ncbi:MAG: SpoIIE family protein phosphatase [Clostridia bacterium]|nr:SpoIIE family protein phosphatase [Clostridia bacterium]
MKNLTYKSVLKYLFCTLLFYFANNIIKGVPFSISLLTAFLNYNFSLLTVTIIFCIVNFISFSTSQAFSLFISASFLLMVFALYKRKKRAVKGELIVYLIIALIPYLLFDFNGSIYTKLAYSAIIYAFAVIFNLFIKVILVNQFKLKSDIYEKIAFAISTVVLSFGLISVTSFNFYKFIVLTATLFFCSFYKNTKAVIPTFVLALSLSVFSRDFSHIAVFEILCITALIFIKVSRFWSGISVILLTFAISYFCGELNDFKFIDYFYYFAPTIIFLFIPQKVLLYFEEKITKFGEPLITREIINIERGELSLKLNNLAQTFSELENSLDGFDKIFLTKEHLVQKIADEILFSVCSECNHYNTCNQKNKPEKEHLVKLINIGITKGKVTLIDLSRDFSEYCYSATNMLNQVNKLLESYKEKTTEINESTTLKNTLQLESHALSEVLKHLAFELSHKIEFDKLKERLIFESLVSVGVIPNQILFIEDKYHIIFDKQKIVFSKLAQILSSTLNERISLITKSDIGDKVLTIFSKSPKLDACFGIATTPKEGCEYSGDCHMLTKINNGKFMVTLCDGMGSGKSAQINSSLAISLFENFYKIGLTNQNATNLCNKLLSVCTSESFSTLDCAIFDLYEKTVNVIKLGASYGFLICDDEVKILENNSLPLGILEEITPNYYTYPIKSGDLLVVLSDGVSDAFFSSTDMIDFLTANKSKNPQVLASKLMSHAIQNYGGKAKDDMTVIVVKVY